MLDPSDLSWWYGWMVLFVCTSAKALKSFGQNNTLFLSVPGIERDVQLSHTQTGLLMCLACLASAITQPFAGRLQDRFGGRVTIPAALLLLAVFLWLLAGARSAGEVLFGFVGLRTFGLGMLDTFTAASVNQWFIKSRGKALSYMTIGFFVGTGAGTVQVLAFVKRRSDWRAALSVGGVICTVSAPLCALLIRSTPEGCGLLPDPPSLRAVERAPHEAGDAQSAGGGEHPSRHDEDEAAAGPSSQHGDVEEKGGSPGNILGDEGAVDGRSRGGGALATEQAQTARFLPLWISSYAPDGDSGPGPPLPVIEGVTLREASRSLAFWLLSIFTFGFFFQASGTDFHLAGIVAESGTVDVASTLSIANAVASAVLSLAVGHALDKRWVPARIVLLASSVLLVAYTLLLTVLSESWLAIITGLIKGSADACSNIGVPFAVAGIFGRAHNGEIFSINRSAGVVASGIGPLIFGFARDQIGRYRSTLEVSTLVPLAMALASVLMPWHGRPFYPREAARNAGKVLRGEASLFGDDGGDGGGAGQQRYEMVGLLGGEDDADGHDEGSPHARR